MKDQVAARLRQARKNAGFRSVADAAASLGVSYPTYAAHENGNRTFDVETAAHYARRYKISLDWLLTGRGQQTVQDSIDSGLAELFRESPEAAEELREDFRSAIERRLQRLHNSRS